MRRIFLTLLLLSFAVATSYSAVITGTAWSDRMPPVPISGLSVSLETVTMPPFPPVTVTTATDGVYSFAGVFPGTYRVYTTGATTVPMEYTVNVFGLSDSLTGYNFTVYPHYPDPAQIGGKVTYSDGTPVSSQTITVYFTDAPLSFPRIVTTGTDGRWETSVDGGIESCLPCHAALYRRPY
jgi:hypothetical protein